MNEDPKTVRSRRMIEEEWPIFTEAILARLRRGAEEYGDKSLDKSPLELAEEAEQECLDINGWSFLNWVKIQRLKDKLRQLELVQRRQ